DANVPMITGRDGYDQVATQIQRTLNQRGFGLIERPPRTSARWSMSVLRTLGGAALRNYVPSRLVRLEGRDLEVTLYPPSVLLRGSPVRTVLAHGVIAESLPPCAASQTTDAAAQAIEQQIRRVWSIVAENPAAHTNSYWLRARLDDITR